MTRKIRREDEETNAKRIAGWKTKRAETLQKEALRSGQWPEPSNRARYHPEALHMLFSAKLKPGEHVSGMA